MLLKELFLKDVKKVSSHIMENVFNVLMDPLGMELTVLLKRLKPTATIPLKIKMLMKY